MSLSYENFVISGNILEIYVKRTHNSDMCHLCHCGTSGTNWQMAISQQEIVEMLRKLVPRVINTYKFKY